VIFFLVAEASGSLTILGETIRAGIVLSLHFQVSERSSTWSGPFSAWLCWSAPIGSACVWSRR
jgi:hypothetical protein